MPATSELKLEEYVKEVLQEELGRSDQFLEDEDLKILLCEEGADPKPRATIVGYPTFPLYREVASMLQQWMEKKSCPALELPKYELLDEKSHAESREAVIASITPLLEGLSTLWTLWCREEIKFRVREGLGLLGKRGILDLLGIRKTVGTKEMFPVPRKVLLATFQAKHSPSSQLSVGARALSKHFHRDMSSSWWGDCTGTEEAKNAHALKNVNRILNEATWINIHWLPQDVFIVESREIEGYGARWQADGSSFRGFLEPQMVDGHEVGWRH